MVFGLGTYGIGFAAGALSVLSPCVLPLVPILIGTAASAHRRGPLALAAGLTLSFAVIGVLLASAGASLGLDPAVFRNIAALMLLGFGVLLLSSGLQERFAVAASGASSIGQGMLSRLTLDGLPGQFVLGLLLGVVWSPCVGPTLGATITLASQGQQLGQVMLMMALFGLGAGLPLVILGSLSREAMLRMRGKLLATGQQGKKVLGAVMLLIGIFILTGLDKKFETWILDVAPAWLTQIGTSL
ncbi:MAG TPA: cytochrome c biogenesis CcdA family protein [Burkholderiales bacterium]|nr:cytochrome c biogenesis CcdA family protein [Burkholderiales bacterium]